MDPQQLRDALQHGTTGELWRRRAVVCASLTGMASMTAVTLLQMGLIGHLPDPPLPGFNSDKVDLSATAYRLGLPDGPLGGLGFAANLPLAALGGAKRWQNHPWIPLLAAVKAMLDGAVAGWYLYEQPAKEHTWCAYCIAGQLASIAVLALSLPEARVALATLRKGRSI